MREDRLVPTEKVAPLLLQEQYRPLAINRGLPEKLCFSGSPRLILVVADDEPTRQQLSHLLEQEGYVVITASDARETLAQLVGHQPALVILNTMMPSLDAFLVLHLIREHSKVPVIMLPVRREVARVRHALILGAYNYVNNPLCSEKLLTHTGAEPVRTGQESSPSPTTLWIL